MNQVLEAIQVLREFQDKLVLRANKVHREFKVQKVLEVIKAIKVIHLLTQILHLNN